MPKKRVFTEEQKEKLRQNAAKARATKLAKEQGTYRPEAPKVEVGPEADYFDKIIAEVREEYPHYRFYYKHKTVVVERNQLKESHLVFHVTVTEMLPVDKSGKYDEFGEDFIEVILRNIAWKESEFTKEDLIRRIKAAKRPEKVVNGQVQRTINGRLVYQDGNNTEEVRSLGKQTFQL